MKVIRKLRRQRGWSGAELARRARVNSVTLYELENGRRIPPAQSVTLRRLARALGWQGEPAALLDEVEEGGEGK